MIKKLRYFVKSLFYLKIFFSPFKRPKISFYLGKISIGTPYFYPRKWIRLSDREAKIEAIKSYGNTFQSGRTLDQWYNYHKSSQKAVPKRFGFDFVSLGWKTKWKSTDYRFEWSPMISFVFFKWQFVVFFIPEHKDHAWTSWLYYEKDTDKTKSVKERINQCKKEFPQNWIYYKGANPEGEKIDYYNLILKNKYL